MKTYILVEFISSNDEIEAIPACWMLKADVVSWPPYKTNKQIAKAILNSEVPKDDWKQYKVKVVCSCGEYNICG